MIRLRMKKYNMIIKEKLEKYQLYHQAKLISMNIFNQEQIKTIEDQTNAIQNQGEIKTSDKGRPLTSKQKEMFNKIVDQRLEEIR